MKSLVQQGGTVSVERLDSPGETEALLRLFEAVAAEEGWQPGDALRSHPQTARYLAISVDKVPVGGLQVVLPDTDGSLPFGRVWPEVKIGRPCHTAHITVLALRSEYRGRPALFWSLCVELWRFLASERMEAVLLEATPSMLNRYRRLGFPLETVGSLRPHWGEECYLCRMDLRTVAGALLLQARHSPIYRRLIGQAARSIMGESCTSPPALP